MTHVRSEIRKVWGEEIESSIWEETKRICDDKLEWDNIDNSICRHIYHQVLMKILVAKRKGTDIEEPQIAQQNHSVIYPDLWKTIIDKQNKTNELLFETRQEVATDDFMCPRCHEKKCTFYQLQTRSADEPMTTFVTCVMCGKRWKC